MWNISIERYTVIYVIIYSRTSIQGGRPNAKSEMTNNVCPDYIQFP